MAKKKKSKAKSKKTEASIKLRRWRDLVAEKKKPVPWYKRVWNSIKRFVSSKLPSKRDLRFWWQRRTRGWDDSDTWALDSVIARFTLLRLQRFRDLTFAYPGNDDFPTFESWIEGLDKMIYAMEICARDDDTIDLEDQIDWDLVQEGLDLFGKYFRGLWW